MLLCNRYAHHRYLHSFPTRRSSDLFVDNDVMVVVLAEAYDDDLGLIAQSLVMITVGTGVGGGIVIGGYIYRGHTRSEEHTSELQSRVDLVCRLLLEKKKGPRRTATD